MGTLPGVEGVGVSPGEDTTGVDGETTGSEGVGVIPGVAEGVFCTGKTATSYTLSLLLPPHNWLGLPEQVTPQVMAP